MSSHKITNANIKEWARDYDGEPFDAILCDPPYELGFMGKSWDSSGIAFDKDMWADLFRHIKPGGHLLAFSGSRTYHRMAVAIEDAGFEIRDMIEWVYGSGFPKSLNIGKAVDKIQGNEREAKPYEYPDGKERTKFGVGFHGGVGEYSQTERPQNMTTKGTSPYEGYGTALKPAHEPCVLARKPLDKGMTVANNVLKHGTGGLNIDGTRVEAKTGDKFGGGGLNSPVNGFMGNSANTYQKGSGFKAGSTQGRFPANLIHDGSDEVEAVFPQTKSGNASGYNFELGSQDNTSRNVTNIKSGVHFGDSGSASRFFYTAKASKSERNAGLEGFEEKEATSRMNASMARMENGVATNDRAEQSKMQNSHPTVKPLSLTKYLATLIKPPTGGRLLVPFSGSGSEMIGALQAGWEYVEGVELTEEYIPIAEARIKYWLSLKEQELKQLELV